MKSESNQQLEAYRATLTEIASVPCQAFGFECGQCLQCLARKALSNPAHSPEHYCIGPDCPDCFPASEPTPLQRAYGGKVRTVNTDPSNQEKKPDDFNDKS